MTWPFGGLPLGGVFLGQAHGPLVQLARLGGPLLITAGVWAAGVAVATPRLLVVGPAPRLERALPGRRGRGHGRASWLWPSPARWPPTGARPSGRCGWPWSRAAGSGA